MQTVDIQVILKGLTLDQGQMLISAIGGDPESTTQLVIYSDADLTTPIVGPWFLSSDGWVLDNSTGTVYETFYINEDSYSIQLMDKYGVSVFNPFKQSVGTSGSAPIFPNVIDATSELSYDLIPQADYPVTFISIDPSPETFVSLNIPTGEFTIGSTYMVANVDTVNSASITWDVGVTVTNGGTTGISPSEGNGNTGHAYFVNTALNTWFMYGTLDAPP